MESTYLLPSVPDRDFWAATDPLAEVLHLTRMSGAFYALSELTAPWGLEMPPIPDTIMFHVVTEGRCWVEVDGESPQLLEPGTLSLVPHGQGHRLAHEEGGDVVDLFSVPRQELGERYELIRYGGGGESTKLVCGAVHFDSLAAREFMEMLPRIIHVNAWEGEQVEWLHSTLRFMAAEARELRPGGETIVTRLSDVLVIQALRSWLAEETSDTPGWLRALRDPQIGHAIVLVHRDPSQPWTVESLAQAVGMSRSAFALRFRDLAGETPMQYVTRWRMRLATQILREEQASIAELADRLGYGSEAAFSRAFKRSVGTAPGQVRKEAQAAAPRDS